MQVKEQSKVGPKGVAKRNQLGTSESNKAEAQGGAWASQAGAAFSNLFTSELAWDCEIASLTRFVSSPAFRALREMKKLPRIGFQKKYGARPACRDGGVFEKTSASLLARGFAKKPLHSRGE